MLERYNGIEPDPEGAYVLHADAQATIADLQGQVKLANIDQANVEAERNDLQQRVAQLEGENGKLYEERNRMRDMLNRIAAIPEIDEGYHAPFEECIADGVEALVDEYAALKADHARVLGLVEAATKLLTELTIIPIGCSREQELAWKKAEIGRASCRERVSSPV